MELPRLNVIILRVATVNILNDPSRWHERRGLLVGGLAEVEPDLIALQEVTGPPDATTAHWLAGELGGYSVSSCPKVGRFRGRAPEGIAILSRLPVESHETLDLRGQGRTAQLVRVRVGGRSVAFVNGHYYWFPAAHAARARQVGLVLEWVEKLEPGTAVILCGDFNALPDSLAIARMRLGFASTHEAAHGREPEATCPTPLVGGNPVREAATRWLLRRFTNRPGESWRGVLDYIFASRDIRVVSCDLFLDRSDAGDPGLYASDHFGLVATLDVSGGPAVISEGLLCVSLHTPISKTKVASLFEASGWLARKCAWTDYEIRSPFAELVIEAETPILLHGPVADPEANADRILAPLRRAGIGYSGEYYDANGELLSEFRWGSPESA